MAINRIDLTDVQNTLQGSVTNPFELTDLDDGALATVKLASGRSEEFGGQIYRVESGDYSVTDSGVADGIVFIHLTDNGDGTADAFMDTASGAYDPQKGGWYNGTDKVIFSMNKASSVYSNKGPMIGPNEGNRAIGEIFPIHLDIKRKPNPFIYAPCDGAASLPSDNFTLANDNQAPDLTDDRFLQGSGSWDESGTNDHEHRVYTNNGSNNADTLGDGQGIPSAKQNGDGVSDWFLNPSIKPTVGTVPAGVEGLNTFDTATVDSRPKRFSIEYYIRIN